MKDKTDYETMKKEMLFWKDKCMKLETKMKNKIEEEDLTEDDCQNCGELISKCKCGKFKNKIEELEKETDYERFSKFWEKARNFTDEDGDNILEWDKTNMAHVCFTEGFEEGSKHLSRDDKFIENLITIKIVQTKEAILKKIEEIKNKIHNAIDLSSTTSEEIKVFDYVLGLFELDFKKELEKDKKQN